MTGNIAIDVAIGLIFIYTLYSLLATTVSEFIATTFQLRANNLKLAIRRMLDDDDKNILADKFINTSVIKYMASNRFSFFRKVNTFPSYINTSTFSQALIYILKDGGAENETVKTTPATNNETTNKNQQPALPAKDVIKNALDNLKDSETKQYLLFLFNEANGDIDKFTKAVETWFDSTMERTTGWYKKNLSFITFGLALIIAMLFNIDSFQMAKRLSVDPKAREQYVQMAGDLLKNKTLITSTPSYDTTLRKKLKHDTILMSRLKKNGIDTSKFINDSVTKNITQLQKVLIHRMDTLYTISQKSQSVLSFERKTKCCKWLFDSWNNFLGCLVTAIALSLGSPFWFDMLNKLMKLRSSLSPAVAAEDSDDKTKTQKTPQAG